MNILVTGSTGFLGGAICRLLHRAGHTVTGLGRRPSGPADVSSYLSGDLLDDAFLDAVAQAVGQVDAVVHAAACISYDPQMESRLMMTNIIGTQKTAALARRLGAEQIVFLSSIPVIGKPRFHPVTEEHPLHPETAYHVSKLAAELLLQAGTLPAMILRVPAPVGIGMDPGTILPVLVSRCLAGKALQIYGQGSRIQTYLAAEDIARAVELALSHGGSGLFLLPGEAISNADLARLCRQVTGSASPIILGTVPDPHDGETWDISGEKAAAELGFVPQISLRSVIRTLAGNQV